MSISIQTNVTSLFAQESLATNSQFQSNTIQQLTSGYRINKSGDDAAGLAVANKYRSDTAELTQGVRNANDGVSTLQIVDGGLSNISNILDRLKTLATQSASNTFTGDRTTLNNEYSSLLTEINRQADNIGLGTGTVGGRFNTSISVYIGGSNGVQSNAQVGVNLSGTSNQVTAAALGLASTSVIGGGNNDIGGTAVDLRSGTYLASGTQAFTFNLAGGQQVTATVGNNGTALTGQQAVDQLNSQISSLGINANIDQTTGQLSFSGGSQAFTVSAAAASAGSAIATSGGTAQNTANFIVNGGTGGAAYTAPSTTTEALTFGVNGTNTTVTLAKNTTLSSAISQLNSSLSSQGVFAVKNAAGDGIDFQSANAFTVTNAGTATEGVFAATGNQTVTAPSATATATGNALAAISQIESAVSQLGLVQGKVGAGENLLNYSIQLANSQITNFSAAQSDIRDADIAQQAANLTKAQTLLQTSVAALAQANSAPQSVLKLLQ